MSPEQLRKILLSHRRWLQSDGQEGARADLEGADLIGANLIGKDLTGANLTRALLTDADLTGADLTGANLTGADLTGARLNLATMASALLTDANLYRAKLYRATLTGATLTGANLEGANLSYADLSGADLTDAYLFRADLSAAHLDRADLTGAILGRANLTYARLYRADLTGADLTGALLTEASLTGADMAGANMAGATLTGADLFRANLTGANLTDADLTDADLSGATLTDANLTDAKLPQPPTPITPTLAYGRQTRAMSKLRKQPLPLKAGAFKRLFPAEFERVKEDTRGRDFTPELLEQLVSKYGMTWKVTESQYVSKAQRLCPTANDVALLNVDISDDAYTEEDRKVLLAVKNTSLQSDHPAAAQKNLFTVGWVRYCEFPDRLLVEEIQSDVSGVRKGLKDEEFVRALHDRGLSAEEIDRTMALMQPLVDRFYEDALGLVFDKAEASGKAVEMLDYEQKRRFRSPKSVYTDLPRKMGMKLGPSVAMPDVGTVWGYVPNRWRSR